MSVLRTLLASLLILAAGVLTLAAATDSFQAFTSETARRIDVRDSPRTLPPVPLETAAGSTITTADLRGRWVLVDFIYTTCTTYCPAQAMEFARLEGRLAAPIAARQVALLSVSFDPARDGPAELARYQAHAGGGGPGWIAARPVTRTGLDTLLRTFGVTAIPDGLGGYVHNAAINIVDPAGRLVAITDWDSAGAAERYLRRELAR